MSFKFLTSLSFFIMLFCVSSVQAQLNRTYKAYQDKNGLWGFQEIKLDFSYGGKTKTPVRIKAQFDTVSRNWLRDICAVKKGDKWGYINSKGKIVAPFQYEDADGKFVKMNGKWGTINENGNTVIPCTFAQLKQGGALNIASENGSLYGYIDDAGKTVIPFMYEECFPLTGGADIVKTATGYEMKSSSARAKVKINGRYGLIDANNKYVLYPVFKDLQDHFKYNSPYIPISLNGLDYSVADRDGRILMPYIFRIDAYIDRDGTAKASAPRYNDGRPSSGTINVIQHTYTDKKNTHTYTNISQKYLNKKDSVRFGLLQATLLNDLAKLLQRYQAQPNGYFANQIAFEYLRDSLNPASVQIGMDWLKKGYETHGDVLNAVDLSLILISGDYKLTKDEPKGLLILNKVMSAIAKDPALLESYDALADDEDDADAVLETLIDGFYVLGNCYMNGIGTEKNEQQAISWYEKGANFEDPYCAMALGDLYFKGDQVIAKNPAKALEYYEMATDSYIVDAMYKAGTMYLEGLGTSKNREKAIIYLKKAAALLHKEAKELLAKLGEN